MDPSTIADDLNEVSVLVNVAHRLLLAIRDDLEASSALQGMVDDLDAAHDSLDAALDRLGAAIDQADAEANRQPREQKPAIH
jgi:prefoldin subunit 5